MRASGTTLLRLAFGILLTGCLFGCAGYRTGSLPDGPPVKVFLEPVQNEAYVSGLAPLFHQEVRRIALQSSHLTLVSDPKEADLSAYIRLADYQERQVAFLEEDTGQAVTSRVSLSAILTLSEPDRKAPLIDQETLSVESPVYSDPETAFPNPVDQTKPTLARNLAASVVLALELAGRQLQADAEISTGENGGD